MIPFLLTLFAFFLLFFIDLPFLKKQNSKIIFYYVLLFVVGVVMTYIVMLDIPITPPSKIIESIINFIMGGEVNA